MTLKEKALFHSQTGLLVKVITTPALNLIAKQCGLDFIFYDCEHGVLTYRELHDLMIMGNVIDLPSLVRVPQLTRRDISQVLDLGATGIMVPMIETKDQALQLVEWALYPPLGKRSYSGGANTMYMPGGNHRENMDKLNQQTLIIVQIETLKGVEQIDEILSVNGIDAVIVGPCDLGISMGIPDNVMDPAELASIQRVIDACKRHQKSFGIIGSLTLLERFKKDITWFISAIDTNILREGINKVIQDTKEMIGEQNEK